MKRDVSSCVASLRLGSPSLAMSGIRLARNTARLTRTLHAGRVSASPFTVAN